MDVCIVDKYEGAISNAKTQIHKSLSRLLKKGAISDGDIDNILNNKIKWYSSLDSALCENNINLIIEAIPENEQIKLDMIRLVNKLYKNKDIIYASNTSSISITKM